MQVHVAQQSVSEMCILLILCMYNGKIILVYNQLQKKTKCHFSENKLVCKIKNFFILTFYH